MKESDCLCHCHKEIDKVLASQGIYCKCIKNCIHCNPDEVLPSKEDEGVVSTQEDWEKRFDLDFTYREDGQWLRNIDGYEDEDGNFISQPNQAYGVPDFFKQFIYQELKNQRKELVEKIETLKIDVEGFEGTNRLIDEIISLIQEEGK